MIAGAVGAPRRFACQPAEAVAAIERRGIHGSTKRMVPSEPTYTMASGTCPATRSNGPGPWQKSLLPSSSGKGRAQRVINDRS